MSTTPLTHRAIAVLRAVAADRAEMTCSCWPSLRIDGLPCCDQQTVRELAVAGLIQPAGRSPAGEWVRAELTMRGRTTLHLPVAA